MLTAFELCLKLIKYDCTSHIHQCRQKVTGNKKSAVRNNVRHVSFQNSLAQTCQDCGDKISQAFSYLTYLLYFLIATSYPLTFFSLHVN